MINPLDHPGTQFALGLAFPNPTSSKTKNGPVYRVSFEVDRETWDLFMDTAISNQLIACDAHVVDDAPALNPTTADKPAKGEHGKYAQKLHQSGFFRSPKVWRAVGTDEMYQAWCRQRKCAAWRTREAHNEIIYHHVLRANAAPSREGKNPNKPPYHGIPLCDHCHTVVHNGGETAVWGIEDRGEAKATSDKAMIQHLERWAHDALVATFEVESLTQIDPDMLNAWATLQGVEDYLPTP